MPKDLATGIFYILLLDIFCVLRRVLGKTCFFLLPETSKFPSTTIKVEAKGNKAHCIFQLVHYLRVFYTSQLKN